MPKLKTHKGTAKRIRKTKTGKLMHENTFGRHFMRKKSSSRKRAISGMSKITHGAKKSINRNLGVK